MTLRKISFLRAYNIFMIITLISVMLTTITLLVDKYAKSSSKDNTIASSKQKYTQLLNDTEYAQKNCKQKNKIGFLKIHKAASR